MENEKFRNIWGHHYNDKDRMELNLMLLKISGYDTAYGMVYVHTYIDEYGQIFQHVTKREFRIKENNHYTIEGRIKHGEFKGKKRTYIQYLKSFKKF